MAILHTQDLGKSYGETVAVEDVDLDVPSGSVYALLGPNGSGKTSLIHMIAGLIEPTRGTIEVFGTELPDSTGTVRERVGVVHENFGLYGSLTGREHIEYLAGDREVLTSCSSRSTWGMLQTNRQVRTPVGWPNGSDWPSP